MNTRVRVLILADRPSYADMVLQELHRSGLDPDWKRIETEEDYLARLTPSIDLILSEYTLLRFDARRAIQLLQRRQLDVPFVILSETVGEEQAALAVRQGATDYLHMDHLARLGPVVVRALEEREGRNKRLLAEQALRESELRFRLIAEHARDLIAILDLKGCYVYVSPSHEQVLGYKPDALVGKNALDLMHPDDRASMASWQDAPRLEFRARRADGEWVSLEGSSYLIISREGPLAVMIARDVTERKQSQEEIQRRANEFAALYETTRDLSSQYDPPALLQTIVERATALLHAASGGIYVLDEERSELYFHAVKSWHKPPFGVRLALGEGLPGAVAQRREPIRLDDYRESEYQAAEEAKGSITAVMAVPMLFGGDLAGVLIVNELEPATRRYTQNEVHLLEFFAAQAATALHNAELFQQVRASRERLQILSRRLLQVQELERRNIARELHDEIGQALTGVQLNLQAIAPSVDAGSSHSLLEESMTTIERTLRQVRDLSLNLRPSVLDDFGLVPALNWLVRRHMQRGTLSIVCEADPLEARLPIEIETTCFRVAQEALTNVVRHAGASRVVIELRCRGAELELTIQDDGIGFDVPSAIKRAAEGSSLGLLGLQERVVLAGGQIEIESAPNEGTMVRAVFALTSSSSFVERRTRRRQQP